MIDQNQKFEVRFTCNGKSQGIAVFETMQHAEKFLTLCDQPHTRPKGSYDIVPVTLDELRLRILKKESAKKN